MIIEHAPTVWFDEIDSTNEEARRRADRGEFGPMWLSARRQTTGRGRRGRSWSQPEGNLAATYLGLTDRPPAALAQLGFAAALAVADLVRGFAPDAPITLKWPNDVLIGGAKSAGILLESGKAGAGALWFALGIGVNLRHAPVAEYRTAALAGFAPAPSPEAALDALSARAAFWAQLLLRQGFAPVRSVWLSLAHPPGTRLVAAIGPERVDGRFADLTAEGALVLALADGSLRTVAAGEVFSAND